MHKNKRKSLTWKLEFIDGRVVVTRKGAVLFLVYMHTTLTLHDASKAVELMNIAEEIQ